ncbi:MAG: transglycosylase family protein [Nocardioidaceae bacterium]|nr:transglycosylase family protein [Nocardioidaceae bacterium]
MRQRTLISSDLVTAAAATPLVVTAAPADAALISTWNRLAQCESGGRWHINTGNGYYGGLQISAGTWRAYGGKRFARLPHRATKLEQIRVGERIKRGQGWRAWPACSRRIGLR